MFYTIALFVVFLVNVSFSYRYYLTPQYIIVLTRKKQIFCEITILCGSSFIAHHLHSFKYLTQSSISNFFGWNFLIRICIDSIQYKIQKYNNSNFLANCEFYFYEKLKIFTCYLRLTAIPYHLLTSSVSHNPHFRTAFISQPFFVLVLVLYHCQLAAFFFSPFLSNLSVFL